MDLKCICKSEIQLLKSRCINNFDSGSTVTKRLHLRLIKQIGRIKNESLGLMTEITIWYHVSNLKNVKNTHGGVLFLVKLQASSSMGVFQVFQLYKCVGNA